MPKRAESDKPGGKPFRKETETMEAIFKSLKQTTNRLNTTADAANDLIRLANERLASIGAGVAYAMTRTWSLDAQYSYIHLPKQTYNFGAGPEKFGENSHNVMLGVNYRFGY